MLNPEHVKLAIAPIAWTNDDMPDLGSENTFEQTVSEMALAGFVGCEVGCKYPTDQPELLKHKLDVRGIQICNQWFSSMLTAKPYGETIEAFRKHISFLKAMGAKIVGASEQGNSVQGTTKPVFDAKPSYTSEQWKVVAEGFNEMGRIALDEGIHFTVHHHMGTGVQTMEETDKLLELTDPQLVSLLYDTGHFAFSGECPLEMAKRYLPRIKHVHLKDVRTDVVQRVRDEKLSFLQAVRLGAFTVPGDGAIDFAPIFKVFEESDYHGWMVVEAEQDPALANPFEYAVMAREYIKAKTGL